MMKIQIALKPQHISILSKTSVELQFRVPIL